MVIRMYYLILFLIVSYATFSASDEDSKGPCVVSVSSDGQYAISSHQNSNDIVLWNLAKRSKKIISHNGNIYSAYFIKNSPYFLWQDLNNVVYVQSIYGKTILSFHNFPTYGEVMSSDLTHYYASDINWSIASGYGGNQRFLKPYTKADDEIFEGYQKLLNLTLSENNHYLLSSGYGEAGNDDDLILWNLDAQKSPIHLVNNVAKTFAIFSPDDNYVVSGDEDAWMYVWNTKTGREIMELDDAVLGRRMLRAHCDPQTDHYRCIYFDKDGIGRSPYFFNTERPDYVFAIKFVDTKGHYLRFMTYKPYAILYSVYDRRPIKFFHLNQWPESVNMGGDYSRDEAIDTSPKANVLVIGQRYGNGIIVYRFDPKKLSLRKEWASIG